MPEARSAGVPSRAPIGFSEACWRPKAWCSIPEAERTWLASAGGRDHELAAQTLETQAGETVVRISIDFENGSEAWWAHGGRELWEGLLEGFDNNEVLLDDDIAQSVMGAAAQISGWADGPEYAPHPLRIVPIDEDEEL